MDPPNGSTNGSRWAHVGPNQGHAKSALANSQPFSPHTQAFLNLSRDCRSMPNNSRRLVEWSIGGQRRGFGALSSALGSEAQSAMIKACGPQRSSPMACANSY